MYNLRVFSQNVLFLLDIEYGRYIQIKLHISKMPTCSSPKNIHQVKDE